jgi:hypothetical protein
MAYDQNNQETNVDKRYYGAGAKSIINNAHQPYRRGRVGDVLPAAPTGGLTNPQETNVDRKYYANAPRPLPRQPTFVNRRPPTAREMAKGLDGAGCRVKQLQVRAVSDVNTIRDAAIGAFAAGMPYVIVQVSDYNLDARVRVALDLAETRGLLTPAQRSAVRFEPLPATGADVAKRAFGEIKTSGPITPVTADEEQPLTEDEIRKLVGLNSQQPEMQTSAAPAPVTSGNASNEPTVSITELTTATPPTPPTPPTLSAPHAEEGLEDDPFATPITTKTASASQASQASAAANNKQKKKLIGKPAATNA